MHVCCAFNRSVRQSVGRGVGKLYFEVRAKKETAAVVFHNLRPLFQTSKERIFIARIIVFI